MITTAKENLKEEEELKKYPGNTIIVKTAVKGVLSNKRLF
jgi:hypothetical protein